MASKTKKTQSKKSKVAKKKPVKQKTTSTNAMRVAIAKDVIAQLNSNKLIPQNFTWVDDSKMGCINEFIDSKVEKVKDEDFKNFSVDLSEYVCNIKKCEVCALGALFVSAVSLYEGVVVRPTGEIEDYNWQLFEQLDNSPLVKHFTKGQLQLIESAYEGDRGVHVAPTDTEAVICRTFHSKYAKNKDRMIAIMKNIIDNNGTFDPRKNLNMDEVIEFAACSI